MKALEIKKSRGRLFYDDGWLRLDYMGSGCCIELSRDERVKLIAALLASVKD